MKKYSRAGDVKVGVIGYGGAFNMGKGHLSEMQKAGMSPHAVVEIDPERLECAKSDYPDIEAYHSVGAMLRKSDTDLLSIITPHNTHSKLVLQCLNAGRHVMCEKPMAITTAECDAMISAARKKRVLLSTYHNRHWDGLILQALKIIKSGALGDVVRVEAHMGRHACPGNWWRSSKSISGGILYDWGVHLLEYTLQIINSGIVEVTGYAKQGFWANKTVYKEDTNEDEAFVVVRYSNGAWSTLSISSVDSNPKRGYLEITGTKGTLLVDGNTWELYTHDKSGNNVVTKGTNPKSEWWRFYQNIADHLVKGKKLIITPEWARRPIHILDLGNQSAKKGVSLKAKYK